MDLLSIIKGVSFALGLICIAITASIGFRKVKKVERHLDIPPNWIGHYMGDGYWGCIVRIGQIAGYLLFRRIPQMRPRMERQLGQEIEPIPLRLELWVTIPLVSSYVFWGIALLAHIAGQALTQ